MARGKWKDFTRKPTDAPFRLTPIEERMVLLSDAGLTRREIIAALGWKYNRGSASVIKIALDKRELQRQWEAEKAHAGFTSTSKAHGRIRMEGTK